MAKSRFMQLLLLVVLILPVAFCRFTGYPSSDSVDSDSDVAAVSEKVDEQSDMLEAQMARAYLNAMLSAEIQYTPSTAFPQAGAIYAFKADNGKYLSRIRRGTVDYVEPAKTSVDHFSRFLCILLEGDKIAFRGDGGGWGYLSRIRRGSRDNIESEESVIGNFSKFDYEVNGEYVSFKADNGKYWKRVNYRYKDNIEAADDCVTVYSRFKFEKK